MDWLGICGGALSLVLTAVVSVFLSRIEKRSKSREESQNKFYGLMLEGIQNIGDLSEATGRAQLAPESDECKRVLDSRLQEYAEFRKKINKFKTHQTVSTI